MNSRLNTRAVLCLVALLGGCTVHPGGERQERRDAAAAGAPFRRPWEQRAVTPLPAEPSADDLVRYALQNNADLESRYWDWRAAIEQIPQDGTQVANLAVFGGLDITNGAPRLGNTTLSVGNDPMADIVFPPKLSTAARRALENARAAGLRFRKAQFDLRAKVLSAYADYALQAELARLEEANAQLLETTAIAVEARVGSGAGGQQDLLKVRNELDLSRNDESNLRSQLPATRAQLNALLGREVGAPLPLPKTLPTTRPIAIDDATVLALAAERNPQLGALARDVAAKRQSIRLARLQYLPDLSLSAAATDLASVTQSLMGMVTVPILRHEAIDAAVAQAEANLRAQEAVRRQAGSDLAASLVTDMATLRDADGQLDLFASTILPRAEQAATIARSAYEAGQASLLDLLDAERSLVSLRRLVAHLLAARAKHLADLEAITARPLEEVPAR